jgi:cullin-associated NEDD8-dissociated protein 1
MIMLNPSIVALKTITAELPQDSRVAQKTCKTLTPKLLNQLRVVCAFLWYPSALTTHLQASIPAPSMIDILSILSTLVTRFPTYMSDPSVMPQPLAVLIPLLDHSRPAVRKRAIVTLGMCIRVRFHPSFNDT